MAEHHDRVAVIGAGTRGEFREEDQFACALLAAGLMERGFRPESRETEDLVTRWGGRPHDCWVESRSVEYLRRTNQLRDLDFVLEHQDDLTSAFGYRHGEVVELPVAAGGPIAISRADAGD